METATGLVDAVLEVAQFAFDALGRAASQPPLLRLLRPEQLPVMSAVGRDEVMAKLADAATDFVNAAKADLDT